jgi:DNA topoisomerase-1
LKENFAQVTSSDLTAKMEEDLDRISRGEEDYEKMLNDFWWNFKKDVEDKTAQISLNRDKYKTSATDELCPECGSAMELKIGRFGEYFQCQSIKEHQFPKNYKEYNKTIAEARVKYASQVEGKKCEECGKDLIVRVSKSSLNPYLACPEYKVGNKHTVTAVNFGPCPKCLEEGRTGDKSGVLVQKKAFRGKSFIGCSLDKAVCGYVQK